MSSNQNLRFARQLAPPSEHDDCMIALHAKYLPKKAYESFLEEMNKDHTARNLITSCRVVRLETCLLQVPKSRQKDGRRKDCSQISVISQFGTFKHGEWTASPLSMRELA